MSTVRIANFLASVWGCYVPESTIIPIDKFKGMICQIDGTRIANQFFATDKKGNRPVVDTTGRSDRFANFKNRMKFRNLKFVVEKTEEVCARSCP